MEPSFIALPAFRIIGMHLRATPMTPEIPALWDSFQPYLETIPTIRPNVSYGVQQNMDSVAMKFDYWCGLEVDARTAVPTGLVEKIIPAQEYAVFPCTLNSIGETFGYIFDTWLKASGYIMTGGPYYERYGVDFDGTPEAPLDIYIPITLRS